MASKLSIGDLQSDLFDAAAEGNIEVLGEDYIAKYGKDEVLSFKTPDTSNTIVLIAVRYGHSAFIEKAISLSPDLLRQKNNNGNTPLHEAAQWGTKETVKLLISHLEKSNSGSSNSSSNNFLEVNCDGDTPFHAALRSRNMAVAEELFSYVKDHPDILLMKSNLRKQTPLHLYVQYCAGVSESQYIEYDDYGDVAFKQTLFFQLMKANFLAIYELDSESLSPLMRAAQLGRVLVVSMLLRYRQAIECRDSKGRSFLHYLRLGMNDLNAKDRNYTVNVCKMILEHPGVDILICSRDQDGNTPLHLAILDKDLDLARLISE
ncbi:uncharacterized protein LOC130589928 [Beta vulgaris subsp. vulgaris]|nr:uncharacterized protein LOC130589928 [Beta vulgaris subsp. vulgaris]